MGAGVGNGRLRELGVGGLVVLGSLWLVLQFLMDFGVVQRAAVPTNPSEPGAAMREAWLLRGRIIDELPAEHAAILNGQNETARAIANLATNVRVMNKAIDRLERDVREMRQ